MLYFPSPLSQRYVFSGKPCRVFKNKLFPPVIIFNGIAIIGILMFMAGTGTIPTLFITALLAADAGILITYLLHKSIENTLCKPVKELEDFLEDPQTLAALYSEENLQKAYKVAYNLDVPSDVSIEVRNRISKAISLQQIKQIVPETLSETMPKG